MMTTVRLIGIVLLVLSVAACSTPAEVKEALTSLDEAYADNDKAMKQYRTLTAQINERYRYWYLHTKQRALLNTALKWATTNPPDADVIAEISQEILGAALVAEVNRVRLKGLRKVPRDADEPVFAQGAGDIDDLIQRLPRIVNLATEKAGEDFAKTARITYQGFDDYQTNVTALRKINGAVKRYLDIDVSVKSDDVKEISSAIKQLQN